MKAATREPQETRNVRVPTDAARGIPPTAKSNRDQSCVSSRARRTKPATGGKQEQGASSKGTGQGETQKATSKQRGQEENEGAARRRR